MSANLKRVIKFGFKDFSRNKGMSVAAIFVLVIAGMLVTGVFFFQATAGYLISQIRDKIDITAYFKASAAEEDILAVKDEIMKTSPNVKSIEYVSKEQALAFFSDIHSDNPVLSRALQEVGDNPFLPSLNITTNGEPAQYEEIANILQTSDFGKLIEKVDFAQKKDTIEKVYSITTSINIFGIIAGIILIIISALVVFNTIKLGIENSKEEISTMRIVGASNWFIRGPFIIQGVIYGVAAFLVCFLLTGVFAYVVSSKMTAILPGFNACSYFLAHWWIFALTQLGFGVAVGAGSALVVVKKYLEV